MAAKLEEFFTQANDKWGAAGRMKLAMLTKMSSMQAKAAEDSAENLQAFESAMRQLRGAK
jgi:hypothetical protein